jgi:Nucleotide-binding protein implicated in inhibition of septum formation
MSICSTSKLILASASPRRQELLRSVGLKFKTIPAHVNEDYIKGESPQQHVRRLAQEKAQLIARKYPRAWVLGEIQLLLLTDLF